ncbi:SAM-dependent methyltransferase [Streptosporangium roseum]|uniref:SAM-dependent methyltransferase n=1 Tax=Streptosporangium roseum TaxID=2001 RepID=UPI00332C5840
MSDDHSVPVGIDTTIPHPARVYDYVLGGKNNYAVDREYADRLVAQIPDYPPPARANRLFLSRAVDFMARSGIRQDRRPVPRAHVGGEPPGHLPARRQTQSYGDHCVALCSALATTKAGPGQRA